MTELEVSCLPADLPEFIEVDLSGLKKGAPLHVNDIKLPKGVKFVSHGKANPVLVSAVPPLVAEEAEPAPKARRPPKPPRRAAGRSGRQGRSPRPPRPPAKKK